MSRLHCVCIMLVVIVRNAHWMSVKLARWQGPEYAQTGFQPDNLRTRIWSRASILWGRQDSQDECLNHFTKIRIRGKQKKAKKFSHAAQSVRLPEVFSEAKNAPIYFRLKAPPRTPLWELTMLPPDSLVGWGKGVSPSPFLAPLDACGISFWASTFAPCPNIDDGWTPLVIAYNYKCVWFVTGSRNWPTCNEFCPCLKYSAVSSLRDIGDKTY